MSSDGGPWALAEAFLAHAGPPGEVAASAELERRLEGLVAAGRAAWPRVALDPARFVGYLAARLSPGRDVLEALGSLQGADLYLACACVDGDPEALATFERDVLPQVTLALKRSPALRRLIDEVKQALRVRLLTADDGGRPRLADYLGHGALVRWLQTAAVRAGLNLRRRPKAQVCADEDELARVAGGPDPELDYLKTRYAAEVSAAMSEAVRRLEVRSRTLLRLHYLDGLTIDLIAPCYAVHRATVARWIADARRQLLTGTRVLLSERLKLPLGELDSLMDLVQSRVHVAISSVSDPPAGAAR